MKPLLVGDSPHRAGDPYYQLPLSGAVAQTLCQMAGIAPQLEGTRYGRWTKSLYGAFDCTNVVERFSTTNWPTAEAAATLAEKVGGYEVVVLLGRRAQQAYVDHQAPADSLLAGVDFYEWVTDTESPTGRREVVVLSHPTGLNRIYARPMGRRRAGEILREAIEKAKQLHETRL